MKNELEILLIGLGEADMNKEKADLIDALSLLSLEIETVYGAMSNKMKECIDDDDESTLHQLMKTRKVVKTITEQIAKVQSASKYEPEVGKGKPGDEYHLLNEDMTNQTPWKVEVDGKSYILEKQTWRCMFETIISILAELSPQRFSLLVEKFNKESTCYCRFDKDRNNLTDSYGVTFIKSAGLYMSYFGSANSICTQALEALKFFNLKDSHKVFLSGRKRNVR